MVIVIAGCAGGRGVGEQCTGNDDCASVLQCLQDRCVPRCDRAPECGDGYSCDDQGLCHLAVGEAGDPCSSEVECGPGLACQIDNDTVQGKHLVANCTAQAPSHPAGSACERDTDCRNGTCALGHCVDLCRDTRDCGEGTGCMDVPRIEAKGMLFRGCLPSQGTVTWSIPVPSPQHEVQLPVPNLARSAQLVMSVDDPGQLVGALSVLSPGGARQYTAPCSPASTDEPCSVTDMLDQQFANRLRHEPGFGQSVLQIPSGPAAQLEAGVYRITVASLRPNNTEGTAIPQVTAVVQLVGGTTLDLHFFFLDLEDHPCVSLGGDRKLDATTAPSEPSFQDVYLRQLRGVFSRAGLKFEEPTYDDITDRPELSGLNVADAGKLFALGSYSTGVNIFLVRSLSPIGVQAFGPNPGPAGLRGTPQSGIVIGLDTLCYRSWSDVARLTAHEIARYMGLYHNVELDVEHHPTWRDPFSDTDDSARNLMYFSEFGGTELSSGQKAQLLRSGVLR